MTRMFNTNIDGRKQLLPALMLIKGMGRRFATAVIKKAKIDIHKRAGELTEDEIKLLVETISNPQKMGIPDYFLNHQRDATDGLSSHLIGNQIDANYRLSLEKGKKFGEVRVKRLLSGLKVRGQRTKSNGRRGRIVGVSRKK
ncbi:40S ribosomal protein S18 [Dictyocoela muelleri]|nr:40S ribosomal protein S18 [Dictyocoela muelleri]